ncbi:unnamed protein product, partial [Closterium sp. NIES-54]
ARPRTCPAPGPVPSPHPAPSPLAMAPRDLPPLTVAPSPLASAPRDLSPLAAAQVPCRIMVGKGVARGGSSCPRALQSHAQLRPRPPPPPPPPPWGRGGEGVRGWRILEVQGEAGGDLQHHICRCSSAAVEPSCAATACAARSCSPGGLPPHAPTAAVPPPLPPHAPVSATCALAAGLLQLYLPLLHWLSLLLRAAALFCLVYPCRLCLALGSSCMQLRGDVRIIL